MRRERTWTTATQELVAVIGTEVAAGRRERRLSGAELAERAGVAPGTVRRIEQGDPTVAAGTLFEVARIAGLRFFDTDGGRYGDLLERSRQRLALLPARVREPAGDVDDNF